MAKQSTNPKVLALAAFIVVVIGGGIGAVAYLQHQAKRCISTKHK